MTAEELKLKEGIEAELNSMENDITTAYHQTFSDKVSEEDALATVSRLSNELAEILERVDAFNARFEDPRQFAGMD